MPSRRGFTLLEVLVATLIMGLAVTGLLASLRTSLSNTSRAGESDRAAALARSQMDALLATRVLPKGIPMEGLFPPQITGGEPAGWRARVLPFESQAPPGQAPGGGSRMLERIELIVWWGPAERQRTIQVSAYRTARVTAADMPFFGATAAGGAGRP